ncbi:MAG TPA: LysR family transcriptional regulator [Devosia sp.]|jgi:DNA-binding transcriptional LysR family regulator|nr:LysR family transcriptional regulator [Devosia sp.]
MADLEELRTFTIAARLGSFARAARQLNLSPAMVGRRIQGLEERYGIKLIERTTRSQHLTERGREFLTRAEVVLDAAEALADCSEADNYSGRIRLTAPTMIGVTRLPPVLARFGADHPDVIFEVNLSNRRVDLVGEGFDLAIRVGELPSSGLITRRIGTYRFACCASPEFIRRNGELTHPAQLAQVRCVLNLNLMPRDRWPFIAADGEEITVTVGGGVEIDYDEAQRILALSGTGIVYLPLDLVSDDLSAGRLVSLFPDWRMPSMPIHSVQPSRALVPRRIRAFVEALAIEFRSS